MVFPKLCLDRYPPRAARHCRLWPAVFSIRIWTQSFWPSAGSSCLLIAAGFHIPEIPFLRKIPQARFSGDRPKSHVKKAGQSHIPGLDNQNPKKNRQQASQNRCVYKTNLPMDCNFTPCNSHFNQGT